MLAAAAATACRRPASESEEIHAESVGFDGPVGLQLYSVRNELEENFNETLRAVREVGYREVEVFNLHGRSAGAYRSLLDDIGLRCTSYMTGYGRVVDEPGQVAAEAHALGAPFVVVSWIPHDEPFDAGDLARAVTDFTEAGRALADEGIRFCYHAHGYEFRPAGDGRTLFDRFMMETEPGVVDVEMDVFWVTWPGFDPISILEEYPGRFPLFHLKDMRKGTETGDLSGHAPLETNVPLGEGMIDIAAIVEAAESLGGERYYVEYEYDDALSAVAQSHAYLERLRS